MRMFVRMFVLIFALLALTAPISLAADEQKGLFHEILDKIMIFFENTFPQETRITNFPQEITIYPQATDNAQDENTPSESAGIQSTSKKNDFSISYSEKLGKKGNSIYVKRKKYSGNEKSSFETALDSITDASAETESAPLNTEKDFETENEILENTYTCPVLASPLCEEGTTPEPVIDQGCITGYQCIQTCPDIYITEPICKNGNIEKVYNKDGCLTALNCK
ncbi:hypothetical protein HYU11_05950, partial [Candidatus Woesearchaeota archaeon]|nr:hypothetical protein [Candidatus Woesearchaeota archaeon]